LGQIKENYKNVSMGLVDDGINGYELKSPYSFIRYGFEPSSGIFHLYQINTPELENRHEGHAKEIMDRFFQTIKNKNGSLNDGPYTSSGTLYIKHVIERLAKKYNVRLIRNY
jgi:hypothetical protein